MHSVSLVLRALVLSMLALCFVPASFAATYYINPSSGVDTNAGTSTGAAWRTINKANGTMVAGDVARLMTGTYTGTTQKIIPSNSGTSGNPITYTINPGATVTFTNTNTFFEISGRSYITVQGPITFSLPTSSFGYLTASSNHITISGCTFDNGNRAVNTGGLQYAGILVNGNSTLNTFSGNTIVQWGTNPSGDTSGQGDAVRLTEGADNNLIENNTFNLAGHAPLSIDTSSNVIRNNVFKNTLYRGTAVSWIENVSYLGGADLVSQFNVIEGNLYDGNRTQSIQLSGAQNIVRRNVFVNNGTGGSNGNNGLDIEGFGTGAQDNVHNVYGNRVYHNDFVANATASGATNKAGIFLTNFGITSIDLSNNHFKNNIFTRNDSSNIQLFMDLSPSGTYNAAYFNTNYRVAGSCFSAAPNLNIPSLNGTQTITFYQSNFQTVFSSNDSATPIFVNEAGRDFNLQAGSGCIDRGVALTTTASASSGTSVAVVDARYFSDGKGLVTGDQITIGSQVVTVTAVNYGTNTLTITPSISWASGASIYNQTFAGAAPDAGAFEFVTTVPVGLVSHWKLNAASGTAAADSIGTNTGTTIGGPTWVGGVIDNALNFDGVDDVVSIADADSLEPSGDMTLSAWVKLDVLPSVKADSEMIIRKDNSVSPWQSFQFYANVAGNSLAMEWINTASGSFATNAATGLQINKWYNVVFVKSGGAGILYLNGVNDTASTGSHTGTIFNSNGPFYIGGAYSGGKPMDGTIDDVRIYDTALTSTEVRALYDGVLPVELMPPRPLMRFR